MPRMQVNLPNDLYQAVKELALPASELLQRAIRSELHRRQLLEVTDEYLKDLFEEVGEPSSDEWAWAESVVRRIKEHSDRASG